MMPRPMRRTATDRALAPRSGWAAPSLLLLSFVLASTPVRADEPRSTPSSPGDLPRLTDEAEAGKSDVIFAGSADQAYEHRLRELEEKVVNLKEKVFRSKTRLMLLKERLLNDVIAEAKVVILHRNDMGSSFKPISALYYLDGEKVYFADESSSELQGSDELEVFNQNLAPGNHVLSVEMVYRGDSALFAYLQDYEFKLRASYTFYATKGKITAVRSIGYQRGDITWDLRERPSITFEIHQTSYTSTEAERALDLQGSGGDDLPPAAEGLQ